MQTHVEGDMTEFQNTVPSQQDTAAEDIRTRRPSEVIFALFLTAASLFLLYSAYGISGFKALSAPGSVPMATTAIMVVTSLMVLRRTMKRPFATGETVSKDIIPVVVIVFVALLLGYSLLLRPLGFIPTSFLFLSLAIKFLSRRSWGYSLGISFVALLVIWLIFRIIFSVLMPAGIVPEAELIQFFRNIFTGAA